MDPIEFLELEDVIEIHENQIALYGGEYGIRDRGLLESALAAPRATFGGALLYPNVFAIASAYLFHIVKNHPFIDGNKRAAAGAMLVVLDLNGIDIMLSNDALVELVLDAATSKLDKAQIESILRKHASQ